MGMKEIRKGAGRALAIGGIIGNLNAAPPHGLDTKTNQVDQWSNYSAKVRAPETRRQIKRETDKQLREVAALDKRFKKKIKKSTKGAGK